MDQPLDLLGSASNGSLSFAVDARHIRQLGRELVGDRVTAVSELIKNAYDADATEVVVAFSAASSTGPGGTLILSDNGSGMSVDDVQGKWMVISTASKETASVSDEFCRQRAGRKGIGRFSTESLGARLKMSTTVVGDARRLVVQFRWDEYATGVRLEDVANKFHFEDCAVEDHGTILTIDGLYDRWDPNDVKRVKNAVFLLQPPFRPAAVADQAGTGDPGFQVSVVYAQDDSKTESLGSIDEVRASATAWVSAWIDEHGNAKASVTSKHLGMDEWMTHEKKILLTGPCSFGAAYFIFKRDALNPNASVGVQKARQLAEIFGGVRVYRDGLRVMPYGEPRNDWLGLDSLYRQRSAVLAPIGNTNFFGEVHLSRSDNVLIIDTASREGVVENEAFLELREFLRDVVVWSVNLVASVRKKKLKAGQNPADSQKPESRAGLLAPIRDAIEAVDPVATDIEKASAFDRLGEVIRDVFEEATASDDIERSAMELLVDEVALLRVLASVGGSVAVFSHEVRAVLSQAQAALGDLQAAAPANLLDGIVLAETSLSGLADLASYLEVYLSQTGRRRRESVPVTAVVESFVDHVSPLLRRRGIAIETDVHPKHLRIHAMARSELEAILFNLLSNAVRAIDRRIGPEKTIRIEAAEADTQVRISFLDTGPGIPQSLRDRVFDAFYTTSSAEDAELGYGTGLGLTIVSDIAMANSGTVEVVHPHPPYNTCIEVRLPLYGVDKS